MREIEKGVLFTALLFLIPHPIYGEEIIKKPPKEAPIIIKADRIEYRKDIDTYEAWGSVKIVQDTITLKADYISLDNRTADAVALGNVSYDDGENILISERAELNLNTRLGMVYKGKIFHRTDNYHIEGEEIRKLGDKLYEIDCASFTTCDALVPPWRFRGKNVRIYLDDHISARDVVFYIKDLPALYTPYFRTPITKERKTGFLFPRIGYSNKKGIILQNAFYWAIADNMDSTFYLDWRSKIGPGGGLEYRYIFSQDSRGNLNVYYLRDRILDKDFWELKFNHDQRIRGNLYGKANIFHVSEGLYYQRFGILTEERIQRGLESNLLLTQNWKTSRLYILGQWRQDLTQSPVKPLHKLPEIGYILPNYRLMDLPLYFSLESTAINFWREEGVRGQRLDIYPRISSNLNLGRGFILAPTGGFRETAYRVEGEGLHREIYDLGASIGTKIFRVFDLDGPAGMVRLKHSIEPSLSYTLIPYVEQKDIPRFDNLDFIPETNALSYSLTNRLIGRFREDEQTIEFLTLRVSQSYDLNKELEPFSDVMIEATLMFRTLLSFNTSSTYNPYKGEITSFNSTLTLRGETPWHISIEERYVKRPESLFFVAEAGAKLTKSLDLFGKIWYDATQDKIRETGLRGTYSSQCWALGLNYIGKPDETQVLITIDFKGLGTLKLASFVMGER